MNRRRFLQIVAAAAAVGGEPAQAAEWRGTALGADVAVMLRGPGADAALADLPGLLAQIEGTFSLYRPSELTAINAAGGGQPSALMARALALCDRLHGLTGGAFDPTVQPLWRALADGGDVAAAQAAVGWHRVSRGPRLRLAPGQALTLNGMAQGLAADLLRDWLAARGFRQALVDMGEQAALGGPFRLGIADEAGAVVGAATLRGTALAVSSPGALRIGGRAHILHPAGLPPRWTTVAVEADSAALADGLSTALVFAERAAVPALRRAEPGLRRVWLGDAGGLAEA